jgi:hypothetical protein
LWQADKNWYFAKVISLEMMFAMKSIAELQHLLRQGKRLPWNRRNIRPCLRRR